MADELLAVQILDGDHGLEEFHQLLGVRLGGEVEVQTLVVGFDSHTVLKKIQTLYDIFCQSGFPFNANANPDSSQKLLLSCKIDSEKFRNNKIRHQIAM